MPLAELEGEIEDGAGFWVAEVDGLMLGVMGLQDKGDVTLVRHAYAAPSTQRKGVGTRLLRHAMGLTDKPVLIGTWADASWAIEFYRRNGFAMVPNRHKDALLRKYWSIPARPVETSVVLANRRWAEAQQGDPKIDELAAWSASSSGQLIRQSINATSRPVNDAATYEQQARLSHQLSGPEKRSWPNPGHLFHPDRKKRSRPPSASMPKTLRPIFERIHILADPRGNSFARWRIKEALWLPEIAELQCSAARTQGLFRAVDKLQQRVSDALGTHCKTVSA